MELVYKHSYGGSIVLGATITVKRELVKDGVDSGIHEIIFEQEGFYPEKMADITSKYDILNKNAQDTVFEVSDGVSMLKRVITLEVKTTLNPPPEDVFEIK